MKILILGADGYLGWPTCMSFANTGHDVVGVDNYLRRTMALESSSEPLLAAPNLHERARLFAELTGKKIDVRIGDCADPSFMDRLVEETRPDAVVHYAEQPSAPYSMKSFEAARLTLNNNVNATFNLIWAVKTHVPSCHIVKLGTMGEYGTPNIDIEEGWLDVEHNGRKETFLYPRQAGSLYHTTKVLDTDLLWFYVRTYGLTVTDLMQGPVYGLETEESALDDRLKPHFHYDDIFGTVINRFLAQAVAGVPLTVYGKGGQTRGYLNIVDTLQCVALAVAHPPKEGELRIANQFTEQFTVNEIAEKVREAGADLGLDVTIQPIDNPRKEREEHYYNARNSNLLDLGLNPRYMTREVVRGLLETVLRYKERIDRSIIMPRVSWK